MLIRSSSPAMFSATHEATTSLPASASARVSHTLSERVGFAVSDRDRVGLESWLRFEDRQNAFLRPPGEVLAVAVQTVDGHPCLHVRSLRWPTVNSVRARSRGRLLDWSLTDHAGSCHIAAWWTGDRSASVRSPDSAPSRADGYHLIAGRARRWRMFSGPSSNMPHAGERGRRRRTARPTAGR